MRLCALSDRRPRQTVMVTGEMLTQHNSMPPIDHVHASVDILEISICVHNEIALQIAHDLDQSTSLYLISMGVCRQLKL